MEELMIFDSGVFGEIRTQVIDGKVYFCGLDVARALGYKKPRNAVSRHCDEALKRGATDSIGRKSQLSFVSEANVFRLINNSKLETAKEFERWVFEDVLPQIRKTGGYIPVQADDDDEVIMARALDIMKRTLEHKEKVICRQEVEIIELKNAVPLDCCMIAKAQKCIKIKCSEIYKIEYWRDNPEYKVLKNRVFSHFKVARWHDIPAHKYCEVIQFISDMQ